MQTKCCLGKSCSKANVQASTVRWPLTQSVPEIDNCYVDRRLRFDQFVDYIGFLGQSGKLFLKEISESQIALQGVFPFREANQSAEMVFEYVSLW